MAMAATALNRLPSIHFISFASAMKFEVGYVAEGEEESLLATFLVRRKMAGKK